MEEPEFKRAVILSSTDPIGEPIPGTGRLATPMLAQNEIWQTADGRVVFLDEMTPGHRVNLITWLEQHAFSLLMMYQFEEATGPMAPRGDHALDSFERFQEEELTEYRDKPIEWLQQTPFYKRLQWLIEQDRTNGGGITA